MSANWNAMDVWQILCYHNVFFVLVEYCVVLSLSKGINLESIMTPSKRTEIVSILVVGFSTGHCLRDPTKKGQQALHVSNIANFVAS